MKRNGGAIFTLVVGLGELATGLLLVAAPRLTLRRLDLPPAPEGAVVYLRWIGLFVFAVGSAYLLPLLEPEPERSARLRGAMVWTSLARLLVAGFVAVTVIGGDLPERWCLVGGYDGVLAVVQLALLARGSFGAVDG